MKKLIAFLLLMGLSFSAHATKVACKNIDKENPGLLQDLTIEIGAEKDKFVSEDGSLIEAAPTKEDRLKWDLIEIGKYKMTFDGHTGIFTVIDTKKNEVYSTHQFKCEGLEAAVFDQVQIEHTMGKLEAAGMEPVTSVVDSSRLNIKDRSPADDGGGKGDKDKSQ